MDLKNLNTFIQVAESGSFTKAAEVLGYSQPTISIQIKQLEQELGCQLFDRIGHTVRLTSKGQDALEYAQKICHMCQQMTAESSHASDLSGTIRLATADSMCSPLLSKGFSEFRAHYPNISLKVVTAGTEMLFGMLDHNEADIVCTLDSHIYHTNYVIAAEDKVGVHFVIGSGNLLAQKQTRRIEDLLKQPFLLTEKGMSYRRMLDEMLAKNSLEVLPVLEMSRPDIICDLVEQGMGVAFLPDYVTETAVQAEKVVRLEIEGFETELWKQLLYHRSKWVSPQMEAAIQHFKKVLQNKEYFY